MNEKDLVMMALMKRRDKGMSYTKARQLDVDMSASKVGKILADLEEDGVVERWGRGDSISWRITI